MGDDVLKKPFDVETVSRAGAGLGNGHVYIVDATGKKVASLWGNAETKMALADLIIEASKR